MKVSKILAGLAAAAMSLSMLSMVSFADDADKAYSSLDTTGWGGSFNGELNEAELGAWSGGWWQTELGKEGFDVDTSNAELVVEFTPKEDVAAGSTLFRYIYTMDETEYFVAADDDIAAGETDTYVAKFDDIAKIAAEQDESWAWGTGFGGNFQVAVAGTWSVYVTGATYTEAKCDCTAETCDNWDAEKNQCGCGCNDTFELNAELKFADGGWAVNTMDEKTFTSAPVTVTVTGDGTYTLSLDTATLYPDIENYQFNDATVFVVDINDVYNVDGDEAVKIYPDFKAVLKSVKVDGTDIAVNTALYDTYGEDAVQLGDDGQPRTNKKGETYGNNLIGNIEDNGNYRIEIYNAYGRTATKYIDGKVIDTSALVGTKLDVEFEVEGLSKECTCNQTVSSSSSEEVSESSSSTAASTESKDTSSKAASTSSTTNPSTGTAALAVVGIALAGAAAVTAKKRK